MTTKAKSSSPQSSRRLLLGIWNHLSSRRRVQMGLLLVVILASGGAEMLSLGLVVPFLTALSNPEQLWHYRLVKSIASLLGFTSSSQLVLPATVIFAVAAVFASMIRITNLWLNGRFAAAVGSDLSCEAYRRTLLQTYSVHVQRNTAAIITGTTTHIIRTVQALSATLQMITSSMVAASLLIGLLIINWAIALGAVILFGGVYSVLGFMARKELHRNSNNIAIATQRQIKALQEGLGAIRDVLLDGSQGIYVELYRQADWPQRKLLARNQFISLFPRYTLEALGLVSIALLGGLFVLQQGYNSSIIPLLGALSLGAQRLLPSLQQIYSGWSSLKGFNADLAGVLNMLNQPVPQKLFTAEPLPFRKSIEFSGVHFSYGTDTKEVLSGLNLEIRRGERIALIGPTGSGKSTTVDILMGLLEPTSGRLLVDGADLYDPAYPERLVSWRAAISHVPQSIYLSDSTIAENIAFGVPIRDIDMDRLKKAADQSRISSFIESQPDGFYTFAGERGIRLSGGQRQRIGIARALYKHAEILILDEATSALDTETEKAVIKTIEELSNQLTIIMVAHRLSTIKLCDRVINISEGRAKQ